MSRGFFKTHQSGPKAYIFLFEGNDFPLPRPGKGCATAETAAPPSSFDIARKETVQSLKELLVYRYAFSFYHILHQRLWPDTYPKVTVIETEGTGRSCYRVFKWLCGGGQAGLLRRRR